MPGGPFASLSSQSLGGQVGHTRMLFTTHKISVRLKGQKFLPLSALWGPWKSDSISSVSGQWSGAWIFDFLGLSSVHDCRMEWNSQPNSGNGSEEFSFHVRCLLIPWLTSASDSELWTATQYGSFSFLPPTYWSPSSWHLRVSFSLWVMSISREQQQDLTKKAGAWCETVSIVRFKQKPWDPGSVAPWAPVLKKGTNTTCSSRLLLLAGLNWN